jgi:hypothetical protein
MKTFPDAPQHPIAQAIAHLLDAELHLYGTTAAYNAACEMLYAVSGLLEGADTNQQTIELLEGADVTRTDLEAFGDWLDDKASQFSQVN